ncbi:MAG: fibronectin type III domain-containing protein, partial [Terracidiphilus sp.]
MHRHAAFMPRNPVWHGAHRILPALVLILATFMVEALPLPAEDSTLVNTPQPILGGIDVRLIYTDAHGTLQDYSLKSIPPAVLNVLPPRLQAESKAPLLDPAYFVGGWAVTAPFVCDDIAAQVKRTINSADNQAYNISCVPLKLGILHALIENSWQNSALETVTGKRLILSFYVPALNRVKFTVTSPSTCQQSKSNIFCASDPQYTMLYDVAFQLIATSVGVNSSQAPLSSSFQFPLLVVPGYAITEQALLNGAAYDAQVNAAISSLETHLEIDAGAAIVNWYAALISAVVEALKTLITNAGAIVADVANANLRDQVSSDLSQYLESASAGKAITDEANAFNLLFAALGSANSMGFTQFDIAPGPAPDHTLQFRLTYPPPAKPKLENAAAASNKELHLVPPTIGTGGQQVKPGVPFLVNGSNFLLAYTDELDIDWGQTVAGVAKSQLQWGLKDGTMQTVPVDMDNFKATNLKPSTAYQFRVQECDAITCSPWSDWLEASTESSGSGIVKLWLDNNTSQPIGTAPLGPNGGFAIKATIPAGTAPGTHTI